jgi:ferredoxin--NADP+ reductase
VSDLAYRQYITETLPAHELLGEMVRAQLRYHPTVTREAFATRGRLTDQIDSGELASAVGLPPLDPRQDRFMICGSAPMLRDCAARLDALGFVASPRTGEAGDYVIERAFVDK